MCGNRTRRNRGLGIFEGRLKRHLVCYGHLALHTFTSGYHRITVIINTDLEVCTVEGGGFLSR